MIYSPYGIVQQSYDYNPYKIDNTTVSGYNVPHIMLIIQMGNPKIINLNI